MATPPAWIACLANEMSAHIRPGDLLSPLGCHFYRNRALDQWEITVFASRTEIVGGSLDGVTRPSPFHLDLRQIADLFDHVLQFHWQTHDLGPEDDLGPHVSLEGVYAGHSVWVRVLSEAPDRYEVGRSVDTYGGHLNDEW